MWGFWVCASQLCCCSGISPCRETAAGPPGSLHNWELTEWHLQGGAQGPAFLNDNSGSCYVGRSSALGVHASFQILRCSSYLKRVSSLRGADHPGAQDGAGPRPGGGLPGGWAALRCSPCVLSCVTFVLQAHKVEGSFWFSQCILFFMEKPEGFCPSSLQFPATIHTHAHMLPVLESLWKSTCPALGLPTVTLLHFHLQHPTAALGWGVQVSPCLLPS